MWWILFFEMSMTFIKVVKNQIFKKVYLPLKPTWRSCFFLFHSHDQKQKQNHQISSSRAKTRSTRSQTCVKYKGNIICIKRNTDVNTGDLKILHKKNVQIRLIFQTVSSISPNFYVVCLQPYALLENYDHYGSFGTMI